MKNLLIILFIVMAFQANAQKVIYKGIITYDRKENSHAQMAKYAKAGESDWFEQMKKTMPKYKITRFEMLFNMQKSLYCKSKEQPEAQSNSNPFMGGEKPENIVFKHIDSAKLITQMNVFDKNFVLEDTLPVFNWKITNEYKNICGYNCRKATAIAMDSLFVIAFYTDAIYPSTGPLSINGLPGAILGVVLPRLNTSYFATKVDPILVLDEDIKPATKGEKINSENLVEKIKEVSDSWGDGKYFMDIKLGTLI